MIDSPTVSQKDHVQRQGTGSALGGIAPDAQATLSEPDGMTTKLQESDSAVGWEPDVSRKFMLRV